MTIPLALYRGIKLLIFDLDGTLVETKSGKTFRERASDWKVIAGRKAVLDGLRSVGVQFAIATNQGGIAFGYFDGMEVVSEIAAAAAELGIDPAMCFVCPTHPNATVEILRFRNDPRRKPNAGMLHEAMESIGSGVDETMMVGARTEDALAAQSAGVRYMDASMFFEGAYR